MFRFIALMIVLILGCCLLASTVAADRLILIPEGTTLTTGGLHGEYAHRAIHGGASAYWAAAGISRFEIEGAWFNGFGSENTNSVSAQVAVMPETSFTPALALGIRDISDNTDTSNALYGGRAIYLAVSKGIPMSGGIPFLKDIKFHGGIGTGSLGGVFFGAETSIPGGLHLAGEYDTDTFNFAAEYRIVPIVRLRLSSIKSDIYYGAVASTSF